MSAPRILRRISIVLGIALVCVAGCDRGFRDYESASNELESLIDDALAAGFAGRELPPKQPITQEPCLDELGFVDETVQPSYRYRFPLEMLGEDPDRLVYEVEKLWRSRGYKVIPSDDPGIIKRFATGNNFNLQVFVNHGTGMALVSGNGPCVDPPS